MPLSGDYTWSQTATDVEVRVELRGASPKTVDVYASDTYVKISYAPRLVELDLESEIDDVLARARIKSGVLVLRLPKKSPSEWPRLVVEATKEDREARRAAARARRSETEKALAEQARVRKQEDERRALRTAMAVEAAERTRLEDKKAEEKAQAEAEVYETLRAVQAEQKKNEPPPLETMKQAYDLDADAEDEPPPLETSFKEEQPEEPPALAEPRAPASVRVEHTPRVFPTPMRESKLVDEHQWIEKHRAHLHKNATLKLPKDTRGIDETDPAWLKSRGDEHWRNGDCRSAIHAYTAALELDDNLACLGNRAACHLKLRDFDSCVADCDAALDKADPGMRVKLLARRAAARCGLGDYAPATDDLEEAARMSPGDAKLAADAAKAARLRDAAQSKAAGDAALTNGQAQEAREHYDRALDSEPTFVSALANRAAACLVLGDLRAAIRDCTDALRVFEMKDDATVSGPMPLEGSEKRRQWVLRTLARRGAAHAQLGDLKDAILDYEAATTYAPHDAKLKADLDTLRAKDARDAEKGDQ